MGEQGEFRDRLEHDFTSGFHATEAEEFDRQAEIAESMGQTEDAAKLREQARLARGRSRRVQTVELLHKLRGTVDPDKA